MNFQKFTFAIALFTIALTTQFAHAVMLTHSVAGVLFNETFENQTVAGTPTTGNIFPGVPGAEDEWFVTAGGASTVLNRASGAPINAYEGSKYVQVDRPAGNTALLIGDFGPSPIITPPTPGGYGTGVLTIQFAAYISGPAATRGFVFRFDNLDNGALLMNFTDVGMQITAKSDGTIAYAINNSGTLSSSVLTYTPDVWQKWVIVYNLDTDLFSLSVGASTVTGLPALNNLSNIGRFSWQAIGNNSGSFYLDAIPVPEPSGFALFAAGVVGACLSRLRRRDH